MFSSLLQLVNIQLRKENRHFESLEATLSLPNQMHYTKFIFTVPKFF